jgi:integrase
MSSPLPRYLFRRGSTLYLRLQPPGQRAVERSLGTSDVKAAEIAAADLIKKHKQLMYGRRLARLPRVESQWLPTYAPGMHDGFFATERELRDLATGKVIGVNGGPAEVLIPAPIDGPSFEAYDAAKERPTLPTKGSDDDLLETYLKRGKITGLREKQARDMWHLFKTVVDKPIAKCTRKDGEAIVTHLVEQAGGEDKIKRATLHRTMVPLVATANLAIKDGVLTLNPFHDVVGNAGADSDKRKRFTDDDMVLIRANLHLLSESDQLLVRVLATTGMRRGEAFQIDHEESEDDIRFCVVGTKTDASLRRVPFPKDLIDFLPNPITKPLFTGRLDSATKRLRKWMSGERQTPDGPLVGGIGITDPNKVPSHSFRHRAKRRLINADVRSELINAVGGWADDKKKNSGDDYGKDEDNAVFSITKVREAIDKIGF